MKLARMPIASLLIGIVAGYLVLHPYVMIFHMLSHGDPTVESTAGLSTYRQKLDAGASAAFSPMMLSMGIAFAAFGGIIGLLIGTILDRKRRLYATEYENRKNKDAVEVLQKLTVTLAHYLLNANMIIGGKVRRCRKATQDQGMLNDLTVIEEQGRRIDAVINGLRMMTELKTADYTTPGRVAMFDISREIEERLAQMKRSTDFTDHTD